MKIILVLLLFSCTKQKNELNEKVLNQTSTPVQHFDPQLRTGLASGLHLSKSLEALYETHPFSPPDKILPNLADGMPKVSADGKTYTIKVKKNVFYHPNKCFNGQRELIAKDFENSFKRVADPKLVSPHFSYWKKHLVGIEKWYDDQKKNTVTDYSIPLEGVKAIDKYTIEFKIKEKNAEFPFLLADVVSSPVPKEAIDYYKNDFSNVIIGTGPFIMKEHIKKNKMLFIANPKFRDKFFPKDANPTYKNYVQEYAGKKLPLISKINVQITNQTQTAWLNFMKGNLDYVNTPRDNMSETFMAKDELTPKMKDLGIKIGANEILTNVYYFGLNTKSDTLKNKLIRQAIGYALDYDKYHKLFFANFAELAHTLTPPNILGNKPKTISPYVKVNIEKAKELLKKAGHENGKGIRPLEIIVKNKTFSRQIGEFFQNELAKINIPSKLVTVSWERLLQRVQNNQFDAFYLAWFVGLPTAFEFFELIYGPNYPDSFNRVGYQNEQFDNLFRKAKAEDNLATKAKLIRKMNDIFIEDLPIIPLVHRSDLFVHQGWLKNYVPTQQYGGLEQYIDIDLDLKRKLLKKMR